MMKHACGKLHIIPLGVGLGIAWALSVFFLGLMVWLFGWGTDLLNTLASFYTGFKGTLGGSLLGLIWGFVHGFIFGVILAAFYNLCSACCPHYRRVTEDKEVHVEHRL